MADNVQWIKLKVGMFDGNSFKKIKRAKFGGISYRDKLTAVWFELLDLAGKSNANGCLIDNNEIPYHTYEDIATMLDREEKEIEVCMEFFIAEKMIEIIDEIYCLTNFMQYQNQDGLNKLREQKRIAQQKWRERTKLGVIEQNVDEKTSTSTSTSNLPSYSNSNSNNKYNKEEKADKPKHKHGEYSRVLLTDEEYKRLIADFGAELAEKAINGIDASMEETHNKNKWLNHNLTIRRAIREKWSCVFGKHNGNDETSNPFLQIAKDEGIL